MHQEEDWVMERVDCYELFEFVDSSKLLEFFKIGAAAHKRLSIRKGKRPEGEESEDDNDDDAPSQPPQPPQPQQPQQPQPPQQQEEAHHEAENEEAEQPKDDVPQGQSRADDEDEEEELNDPIGYNSPISSINLITTDEEEEEEETQGEKGLEMVVYHTPRQPEGVAQPPPINQSTSNPTPSNPTISASHLHAHLNEMVKVLLEQMEAQNNAIKEIMEVMQRTIPREARLHAEMCVSMMNIQKSVASNTKELSVLTHAVYTEIPKEIDELKEGFGDKLRHLKDEWKLKLDLLKLSIAQNSQTVQHSLERELLDHSLKLDAQTQKLDAHDRKIDDQTILLEQMSKNIQDIKDSQENLTKTLLNFLNDAKKGEGVGISKEHHQFSSKEGSSSQPKTRAAQRSQAETVTPAEMEEFKKLFRSGHWGKYTTKSDALYYFLESKKKGETILKVAKSRKKGYKGQVPTHMECTEEFLKLYQDETFGPRSQGTYERAWEEWQFIHDYIYFPKH
ncbi:hypothetical protein Dimus_039753 [Dionaea muscipula]